MCLSGLAGCAGNRMSVDPNGVGGTGGAGVNPRGTGGSAPTTSAPAARAGIELVGSTGFRVNVSGGMPTPMSACSSSTSFALDFASKLLSWSYCDEVAGSTNSYFVNQSSRTLSDAEMKEVSMVLANQLSLSNSKSCGEDKANEVLTMVFPDHTTNYWDDFYAGCQGVQSSGNIYIYGLDGLIYYLWSAARYATVPTEFDTLDVSVQPMPSPDLSWMATCDSYSESEYKVVASTRELSWSLCRATTPGAAFASVAGSRILTDAELASVSAGLAALVLGASGECTTARPDISVSIYLGTDEALFSSDVGACTTNRMSPPYVVGLDSLSAILAGLVH